MCRNASQFVAGLPLGLQVLLMPRLDLCSSAFVLTLQLRAPSLLEGKDTRDLTPHRKQLMSVDGCLRGPYPSCRATATTLAASTPASGCTNRDQDKQSKWQWTSRGEGRTPARDWLAGLRQPRAGSFRWSGTWLF